MSNAKHTPGPWKIGDIDITPFGTGLSVSIDAESHGELATVVWRMEDDQSSPVCEANARLIAAAPELLEALQGVMKCFDDGVGEEWNEEELTAARSAVAKAKGETL